MFSTIRPSNRRKHNRIKIVAEMLRHPVETYRQSEYLYDMKDLSIISQFKNKAIPAAIM